MKRQTYKQLENELIATKSSRDSYFTRNKYVEEKLNILENHAKQMRVEYEYMKQALRNALEIAHKAIGSR